MHADRIIKILSSISLVLVSAALLISHNSPATECEASIYSATPLLVWAFLLFSTACGFAILVYQVHTKEYETNNRWLISLLLIMMPLISMLWLPVIRGYLLFGDGDPLTHLGLTRDILSTGHVSERNIYPIMHISVAQLSRILNIEPMIIFRYIPQLFNIFYVLFTYLLAKNILANKGQVILTTAVATIFPVAGAYVHGYDLGILALPLIFLLLVKSCRSQTNQSNRPFKILFIMMLVLLPMFHIYVAFIIGLVLATIWLPQKIYTVWKKRQLPANWNYKFVAGSGLLLLALSIVWITQFPESSLQTLSGTGITIEPVLPSGYTYVERLLWGIKYAQEYGYCVVTQFFRVYGVAAAYLLLALIAFFLLWRGLSAKPELHKLFAWCAPIIVCGLALIIIYMTNVPAPPERLVAPMVVMSTPFVGFLFCRLIDRARDNFNKGRSLPRLLLFLVTLVLVLACVSRILTWYPSSYNYTHGERQLTRTAVAGMDWFLHKQDTSIGSVQITAAPFRYAEIVLTPEERVERTDIDSWYKPIQIPWHFGYPDNPALGQFYAVDKYLILLEMDRLLYQEIYIKLAKYRFYPSDFERLAQDHSLDKLYSNKGLDVWFIHASVIDCQL